MDVGMMIRNVREGGDISSLLLWL